MAYVFKGDESEFHYFEPIDSFFLDTYVMHVVLLVGILCAKYILIRNGKSLVSPSFAIKYNWLLPLNKYLCN